MQNQGFTYFATLTPASAFAVGEPGFVVKFPDLPEAITQGEDKADALAQAADALEEAIAARMKHGDDIPIPTFGDGHPVSVPTQAALKVALYLAVRRGGIQQCALAQRLGKDEKEIRRLLDPLHRSSPRSVERALLALGKRVNVSIEDVT